MRKVETLDLTELTRSHEDRWEMEVRLGDNRPAVRRGSRILERGVCVWVINWQCAHRRCAPLGGGGGGSEGMPPRNF